jgi:hypothetical protein
MTRRTALHLFVLVLLLARPPAAAAQEPTSREALIEQEQDAKAASLKPAEPGKAEQIVTRLSGSFFAGTGLHSFWDNAYSGGGFTLGAGYQHYVTPYNWLDVRGSITLIGYKRVEAEFVAPELFDRRGRLSVLGGWREATQVGFYGFGMTSTVDARANYSFQQPYVGARFDLFPTRRLFLLRGGLEFSQWKQNPGKGDVPSVEEVYTPATLPGLGAHPVYTHAEGTVGFDSRAPAAGYARRGGFYGVTLHDFVDNSGTYGFKQVDYEGIQHIPILREAWVISLHAMAQTTYDKSGQTIPFFMMPSIGGGSDLRAYSSWRLRDLNSLYVQAEWRIMVNRFVDMAVFYDAGKVAARRADLDLSGMKSDVGLGFRFHGPASTPLRLEFTHGSEGFGLVISASEVF